MCRPSTHSEDERHRRRGVGHVDARPSGLDVTPEMMPQALVYLPRGGDGPIDGLRHRRPGPFRGGDELAPAPPEIGLAFGQLDTQFVADYGVPGRAGVDRGLELRDAAAHLRDGLPIETRTAARLDER